MAGRRPVPAALLTGNADLTWRERAARQWAENHRPGHEFVGGLYCGICGDRVTRPQHGADYLSETELTRLVGAIGVLVAAAGDGYAAHLDPVEREGYARLYARLLRMRDARCLPPGDPGGPKSHSGQRAAERRWQDQQESIHDPSTGH
jgi:hypothetical protein